jgi:hypothetical protein
VASGVKHKIATWLFEQVARDGRKSLAFRRSLEVKHPCADISDDESHEMDLKYDLVWISNTAGRCWVGRLGRGCANWCEKSVG